MTNFQSEFFFIMLFFKGEEEFGEVMETFLALTLHKRVKVRIEKSKILLLDHKIIV
jgi:hypothetical protein